MHTDRSGNRSGWDAIRDGRSIWQLLVLLQVANALDWLTTLVGVGGLGLPEQAPAARWMVAHLGVLAGATVLKLVVAIGLALMATATVWLCGQRWVKLAHVVGLVWLMGVIAGALIQTVMTNTVVIALVLTRGVPR